MTGHGRYVEDVSWPDTWHVAFLRSPVARGRIQMLDVSAAQAMEGVRAVFTGADLNSHVRSWWFNMVPAGLPSPPRRLLADGDVRFVGEAIAMVLAESRYLAEDAVELIDLEIEAQPPVLSDHLDAWGSPAAETELVHPEYGSNVAMRLPSPDQPQENPALEEILASASHVGEQTFHQHRYLCVPMETRGIIVRWEPERQRMEIVSATQGAHEVRSVSARLLGLRETQVRASAEDVGGGFGQKMFPGSEELACVMAAYVEGCTVRWIEDRNENLMAGGHSRSEDMTLTLAVDESGKIVGMKGHHVEDVGAFPVPGVGSNAGLTCLALPGPYDVGQFFYSAEVVFSNTCGHCAYRGPWMMETVAREQMIDVVAAELGLDPLEFRLQNMITAEQQPFTTATGLVYEALTPRETLLQVAEMADYAAFRKEQAAAREQGRLLGIGLASYVEPSVGFGVMGSEQMSISVDFQGTVTVATGSGNHGQSLETTFAQVAADAVGVDIADVRVVQNDTATSPFGSGTGGSRSGWLYGAAARTAGEKLREKILSVAAVALEASPDDLEIDLGVVSVKGAPGTSMSLAQVASMAYSGHARLPDDVEPGLEASHRTKSPMFMFSNAAHAAVVEVDRDTGAVKILRYLVSEDCGNLINPMVVDGQIAGGVAQGIGGVFFEHFLYDAEGNPLTTTFLDYLLPTAADVPDIEIGHIITPSSMPGGHKPIGEGGAIVSPPALLNAVRDALAPLGNPVLPSQPLTPEKLLAVIDAN